MTENNVNRNRLMVAGLSHVAWADDTLHKGEAGFFRELIDGLQLAGADAAEIWQLVACPVALEELDWSGLEARDQRQLLRFGYAMAVADGAASDEEMERLRELSVLFDIAWNDALEIMQHKIAW